MTDSVNMNGSEETGGGFSVKRMAPVAAIVLGLGLFFAFDLHQYFTFDALKTHRQQLLDFYNANQFLTVAIFMAVYTVLTALSFPGASALTLVGGFLFGTWVGAGVVVISATLGAVLIFLAARYAFGDVLLKKAGPFVKRMEAGFRENAFSYLLLLRLVPVFPFWLVNLVPAFLNVSTPTYALATLIGILPGTVVYSSVGSGLGQVIDAGGTPNLGIITEPHVLGPILGLAALSAVPIVYKKFKGRAAANGASPAGPANKPE